MRWKTKWERHVSLKQLVSWNVCENIMQQYPWHLEKYDGPAWHLKGLRYATFIRRWKWQWAWKRRKRRGFFSWISYLYSRTTCARLICKLAWANWSTNTWPRWRRRAIRIWIYTFQKLVRRVQGRRFVFKWAWDHAAFKWKTVRESYWLRRRRHLKAGGLLQKVYWIK